VGTAEFKAALVKERGLATEARAWEREGADEVRRLRWKASLATLLDALPPASKSAAWKVAVAARMRAACDVQNDWPAEELEMGSGIYVSKHIGLLRQKADHPARPVRSS